MSTLRAPTGRTSHPVPGYNPLRDAPHAPRRAWLILGLGLAALLVGVWVVDHSHRDPPTPPDLNVIDAR